MKCDLCTQRKGKRLCPAKHASICPQCCGEKRVLEIECPENCEYLQAGRARESEQEGAHFFRTSDPHERARRVRILEDCETTLSDIQTLIAIERRANRSLTDADVAEALDCLLKTLRTEDRGILYETTSGNLRADGLRRQLSDLIQSQRYPKEQDQKRLLLKDAMETLELLRAVVASHIESAPSALSFVDFLARNLQCGTRSEPSQSSIIIPGR
jgi:hypothetical protein